MPIDPMFSAVTPDPGAEWPRFTVVNEEDPAAPYFRGLSAVPCHGYGAGGAVRAEGVRMLFSGTAFRLVSPWGAADLSIRLAGMHNVSNALCAAALCLGLGLDVAEVAAGLESLDKVDGRFEAVNAGQPFHVIVDYAHTDDGLANGAPPTDDGEGESGQERGMAGQDTETAAGIFGTQAVDVLIDHDRQRGDDAQPHGATSDDAADLFSPISLCRASASVPTM